VSTKADTAIGPAVGDGGARTYRGLPAWRRGALVAMLVGSTMVAAACADDSGSKASSAHGSSTTTAVPESSTSGAPGTTAAAGTPTADPDRSGGAGPATVALGGATARPVGIDQPAAFGDGVTARLSKLEAIDATAMLPGETSGPAVAVTVEVTNGTASPVDVGNVTADLTTTDGGSATQVTTDPASPLEGQLAAGQSRSGVYVFRVAADARSDVDIKVKYSSDTPIVVFAGSVPHA
jgi:hypothetical protein